ncbi:MAG: universal stress protein [Rhodothermia bacterium]|nr:universal stress protein [Rhodothermia bacterium]
MLYARKLLLPIEFSEMSYLAASWSLGVARKLGIQEVHLVHVVQMNPSPRISAISERVQYGQEIRDSIPPSFMEPWESLTQQVIQEGFRLRIDVLEANDITNVLVSYAESHLIDLIALNTHARTGFAFESLGSVAKNLIRHAPCPVLTLRVGDQQLYNTQSIQQILVPIDFSDRSKQAVRIARSLAERMGGEITAFHVEPVAGETTQHSRWEREYNASHPNATQTPKLVDFLHAASGPRVTCHTAPLFGELVPATLQYLARYQHDLIVIGTHEYRQDGFGFTQSMTERLIQLAPCPVLSFRPSSRSLIEFHNPQQEHLIHG